MTAVEALIDFPAELRRQRVRSTSAVWPVAASVGVWLLCLLIFTRANTFPVFYHPDEESKARTVLGGTRNFNHPQLLILAGHASGWLSGARQDVQAVTVAGRWASATFAAAAVALLAWVGWKVGRWGGFFAVTGLVALCPSLLLNAHYFKEDTALVFGISAVVATAFVLGERVTDASSTDRSRRSAVIWLAAACGMAAAAKYVGVCMLVFALPLLVAWRRRLPRRSTLLFTGVTALTFLVINARALGNIRTWGRKMGQQVVVGVVEHRGLTLSKPTGYFVRAFFQETAWPILLLASAGMVLVLIGRRRSAWERAVAALTVGFLLMISFASGPNHRYVLPAVVMAHFLAAIALVWIVRVLPRTMPRAIAPTTMAAVIIGCIAWLGPRCIDVTRQFTNDSRAKLAVWVRGHLPPTAVVLEDSGVSLGDIATGPKQSRVLPGGARVITRDFAPDFGDLAALRAAGITHVAVTDLCYGRYFDSAVRPIDTFAAVAGYQYRKQWYESLCITGEVIWQRSPESPTWSTTNPQVRLYRVPTGQ